MFKVFVLLGAVACGGAKSTGYKPELDGRIVGGQPANISEFPYQLSLRQRGSHICGASIISVDYAVTAAHCVAGVKPTDLYLVSGSTFLSYGGNSHPINRIIVHPNYDSTIIDYDIALLQVTKQFPVGETGVQAIPVAASAPTEGTLAQVTGWGTLYSGDTKLPNQLQVVVIPIVSQTKCERAYGSGTITQRMICAGYIEGGKDACQGDSGGPLVANGRLVGIVSWGNGCAEAKYPGVYSNVAALSYFIRYVSGVFPQ